MTFTMVTVKTQGRGRKTQSSLGLLAAGVVGFFVLILRFADDWRVEGESMRLEVELVRESDEGVVHTEEFGQEEADIELLVRQQEDILEEIGAVRGDGAEGRGPCSLEGRRFATSDRKDFRGFVSEELAELGLCDWQRRRRGYDVYLGEQFETLNPHKVYDLYTEKHIRKGAIVSSIPGLLQTIGTKKSFADMFTECTQNPDHICREAVQTWLPAGFNIDSAGIRGKFVVKRSTMNILKKAKSRLNTKAYLLTPNAIKLQQEAELRNEYKNNSEEESTVWIVKRQNGTYLSKGIHLARLPPASSSFSDHEAKHWLLKNFAHPTCRSEKKKKKVPAGCGGRVVSFQRFIHTPLLAYKRKFDFRAWAVITSLRPLRLYLMRHAYPKISSLEFDKASLQENHDLETHRVQCMHIQMMLGEHCNVSIGKYRRFFEYAGGYPESTASLNFEDGLSFSPESNPVPKGWFAAVVWPQLERAVTSLLLMNRAKLLDAEADVFHDDASADQYRRFALLSIDAIVDNSGRLVLEEVNTNGIIMGQHGFDGGRRDIFRDDDYFRGLLRLVGADNFSDQTNYNSHLDSILNEFCRSNHTHHLPCSVAARQAISLAVHEEAHAGPHWYRVYPPIFRGADNTFWPNQARTTQADYRAARESSLDRLVRSFLQKVDTASNIHGQPQVPGHARWHRRPSFDENSVAADRYKAFFLRQQHRHS